MNRDRKGASAEPPKDDDKRPLRILLVEDNRFDATLLIELLAEVPEAERPVITHVLTAGVAITQLATAAFDCVLLDLGLPDGKGVVNIERLRAASRTVTIVVMTGLDDEQRAIESLRVGAQEYLVKGRLQADALMRHVRHAIQRHALTSDLEQLNERHKLLAGHDLLTGLANRNLLADRGREAIAQAARRAERLALCFLDLDGFKAINDRLGHVVGDAVLVEVAKTLKSAVRGGDSIARFGGDEFVIVQFPIGDDDDVRESGLRLVAAIAAIKEVEGHAIRMGASMGIALYPDHGDSLEQLLLHGDEAMYGVKRGGGAGLSIKSSTPRRRITDRSRLATEDALREIGNAALVYQPWISETGENAGVEALLRQRHGQVWGSPAELLHASECMGPLSGLSEWVLRTACAQWGRWRRSGSVSGRLAVNMSASEVGLPGFPAIVAVALEREGLPANGLQIEVAEHLLDTPSDQLLENMSLLRQRSVHIVLDRFGRGGGSLTKLVSLPIDGVKLDHSVVSGLHADRHEQWALIAGVMQTARVRGLDVVAVGVEQETEALGCLRLACASIQGSWVAAPAAANDVLAMLGDDGRRARLMRLRNAAAALSTH